MKHIEEGRPTVFGGTRGLSVEFVQENGFQNLNLLGEVRLVIVIGEFWCAGNPFKFTRTKIISQGDPGKREREIVTIR